MLTLCFWSMVPWMNARLLRSPQIRMCVCSPGSSNKYCTSPRLLRWGFMWWYCCWSAQSKQPLAVHIYKLFRGFRGGGPLFTTAGPRLSVSVSLARTHARRTAYCCGVDTHEYLSLSHDDTAARAHSLLRRPIDKY